MKRIYLVLLVLFFVPSIYAQNPTVVTGTITDPNGIKYYPATVSATLTPSARFPTSGGQPINPNPGLPYVIGPVDTNANGTFTIYLFPNSGITPAATQYVFTVTTTGSAPPAGVGGKTFQATITISGTTQDIGSTLSSASVALLPTPTSVACATCVVATAPGVGLAHFAGSTQTVTSSAVTPTDATGNTTGSGNFVLATSPTLVTPALGTPTALVLTSATGLPLTTGVTGTLGVANGGTGQTSGTVAFTIASGTSAMGTSAISSGTCATVVTTAATGVASTDVIVYTPNADPTSVTGYAVSATGSLYIWAYPTTNNINIKVCNNTAGSLTPGALTLNWRVAR